MRYTWDENKNLRNIKERGIPFETAQLFDLDAALVEEDVRKEYPEKRYVAYWPITGRLHVLCFTPIDGGIRVISLRKANQREIKSYEKETKAIDE